MIPARIHGFPFDLNEELSGDIGYGFLHADARTTIYFTQFLERGKIGQWNQWVERNKGGTICLSGLYLPATDLQGVNFSHADLNHAVLRETNISEAILTNASLDYADLRGSDLTGADLRGVSLEKADLSGANLEGATIHAHSLLGARLNGTTLSDLRFAERAAATL